MTKPCKECKRPFGGSHQRMFCCPECAEIHVLKKKKEEKEKARRPWEQTEGQPQDDDSDQWPTPLPSSDPTE